MGRAGISTKANDLTAGDIMSSPVLVVDGQQPLQDAAAFLIDHHIHGAPVVDHKGKVLGVVSLTDIARHEREREPLMLNETDYYRLRDTGTVKRGVPWRHGYQLEGTEGVLVRDVMTPTVIAINATASLPDAVHFLLSHRVHRLLVVNPPSMALVGVVTETDVLKALDGRWRASHPAVRLRPSVSSSN